MIESAAMSRDGTADAERHESQKAAAVPMVLEASRVTAKSSTRGSRWQCSLPLGEEAEAFTRLRSRSEAEDGHLLPERFTQESDRAEAVR